MRLSVLHWIPALELNCDPCLALKKQKIFAIVGKTRFAKPRQQGVTLSEVEGCLRYLSLYFITLFKRQPQIVML